MRLRAIFGLRCPRCLKGDVYESFWRVREVCPKCELKYAPDPGYFVGSLYFSYGLAVLVALPTAIVMSIKQFNPNLVIATMVAELLLLSPLLVRYSRVIWLHFDHHVDRR